MHTFLPPKLWPSECVSEACGWISLYLVYVVLPILFTEEVYEHCTTMPKYNTLHVIEQIIEHKKTIAL